MSHQIWWESTDNDSVASLENEVLSKQNLTMWHDRKMHPVRSRLLENQRSALCLLVSTADHELAFMRYIAIYASGKRRHTPAQNVYSALAPIAPWSCKLCILVSKQPSSWSWPFCGKQVSSDHHIQIACDHIDAFLVRLRKPGRRKKTLSVAGQRALKWLLRTFPALYWVTLCWVCFLQSLPLQ